MAFVVPHLFSLLGFVMAILLVARAAEQRRPVSSLVAWLFAILVVPYVGVPLYLVFGGRKLRQRAATKGRLGTRPGALLGDAGPLATMLCASGAAPPTRGNELRLLTTGEQAYAETLRVIASAERSIDVSTLILAGDETGRAIAGALVERARRGVLVRLLVDALFKFRSSRRLLDELTAGGVTLAWFMPIWGWGLPGRRNANLRLHRKLVLVDGECAIVGGMNLAREYMGPEPLPGRWRDLSVTLTGPAVRDIADVFASDWRFARGEAAAPPSASDTASSPGGVSVQVVGSGPDVESDRIYDALLSSIFAARRRLWIATPYFVPDEALQRALVLAVRRGVDVRVVVPRRSNHLTADLAGASYLRALLHEGGSVRCYAPEMLHAKLVLIDDDLSILGSANLDMRSLFLDYEIALVVTSEAVTTELDAWFRSLLTHCRDLAPATRTRALLEPIARLLAPLE